MVKKEMDTEVLNPDSWVDSYADILFGYALTRVEEVSLAEELVQDTFVAALAARHSFKGESTFKTWLFSILKNKIADFLRKKYRERSSQLQDYSENYLDEFFDERGEWLVKPSAWEEMPQKKLEQGEFMEVLKQCLLKIPEKQGDTFKMREFDGHDREEICKVLGFSSTNYWVVMHRARLMIRRCLERNWFA